MNSYLILFITMIFAWSRSIVAVEAGKISDLRKAKVCNWAAESVVNQMNWINDNWFDTKNSSYSIDINFKNTLASQDKFFKTLNKFEKFLSAKPTSLEQLREMRLSLERDYVTAHDKFAVSDQTDITFSNSAASLEAAIQSFDIETQRLALECPEYEPQMQSIGDIIKDWLNATNNYRSYIDQTKRKRIGIFDSIYKLSLLNFTNALNQISISEMTTAQKELLSTLELDIWDTRVQAWWTKIAIVNGIGDCLHTKYLMYTPALQKMESDLGQISLFEKDAEKVPITPHKRKLLRTLNANRSLIISEIDRLKNIGWEGQLKRQIVVSEARIRIAKTPFCLKTIKHYLEAASLTNSFQTFQSTELLYLYSVQVCASQGEST